MGLGLIVGALALAGGLYLASLYRPNIQQQDMSPNTLESFKATTNTEGSVVPLVFGYARVNSNLLWFGNLETQEVVEEVEVGGSGSGGTTEEIVVGYRYYMDLWHGLCLGPNVSIEAVYKNDTGGGSPGDLNSGGDANYPTDPGPFARAMNPIAHTFQTRFFLGENVNAVPTLHFVLRRQSSAPLTNANSVYGVNPAAVIYDLLIYAGVNTSDIVISTFQDACTYWHGKSYGLNLTISKQEEARKIINRVFTYVDGNLRQDTQGRFELKAWKDTDTHDVEITDKADFKKFRFSRRTWDDVYTDFRANFTDSTQAYTQRTIRVRNTAVQEIIGYPRQITVDLTAYRTMAIASKRLWEMMKRLSYPEAQIVCTVSQKYSEWRVGDVVRINHEDYGIEDSDFRLEKTRVGGADSNEIEWELRQMVENLFDSNFYDAGGTLSEELDLDPDVPYDADVFELPYITRFGREPTYLLLVARKGSETGYQVLKSLNGTDYTSQGNRASFSMHGELDEAYSEDTYSIDDETGILFTPDREDPVFATLSRGNLFNTWRVAILGMTEVVGFQTVTPVGADQIRLEGVVRGVWNTPISTHAIGTEIWVTNINDNILSEVYDYQFKIKCVPFFMGSVVDSGTITAIDVTYTKKAKTPWQVSNIMVTRSGSNLSVEVVPTVQHNLKGAGIYAAENQPFVNNFETSLQYWTNIAPTPVSESGRDWSYTQAAAHTLTVRQNLEGEYSPELTVTVGSADGVYYDDEALPNTSLEKIRWGATWFEDILARNAERLNSLLYITNLLDVNDSGIANTNTLKWNDAQQKFIPVPWNEAFPTTTTTTTTTSSSSTTSNTQSTTSSTTTTSNTQSTTSSTVSTTSSTASTTSTTEPPFALGDDVSPSATLGFRNDMGIWV